MKTPKARAPRPTRASRAKNDVVQTGNNADGPIEAPLHRSTQTVKPAPFVLPIFDGERAGTQKTSESDDSADE